MSKHLNSALKQQRKLIRDPDAFYSNLLRRFPKLTPNRFLQLRVDSMSGIYQELLRRIRTHLEVLTMVAFLQQLDHSDPAELDPMVHFLDSIPWAQTSESIYHLQFVLKSFQKKSGVSVDQKKMSEQAERGQLTSNMITNLVHDKLQRHTTLAADHRRKATADLHEDFFLDRSETETFPDSGFRKRAQKKTALNLLDLENVSKNPEKAFKVVLSRIFVNQQKQLVKMVKQFGNFFDSERGIFLYNEFLSLLDLGLEYSDRHVIAAILESTKSLMASKPQLALDLLLVVAYRTFTSVEGLCRENSLYRLVDESASDSTLIRFNYMGEKVTPIEVFFHLTNCRSSELSSNAPHLFKDPEASDALYILEKVTDHLNENLEKLFLFFDESRLRRCVMRLLDLTPSSVEKLSIALFTKISLLASQYLNYFQCRESRWSDNKDLEINFVLEKFYNFQFNFFSSKKMNLAKGMSLMVFQESDQILQTLSSLRQVHENISSLRLLNSKNKKNALRKNIEKIYQTVKVKDKLKEPLLAEFLSYKLEFVSLSHAPVGFGQALSLSRSCFGLTHHQAFVFRPFFDFYGSLT